MMMNIRAKTYQQKGVDKFCFYAVKSSPTEEYRIRELFTHMFIRQKVIRYEISEPRAFRNPVISDTK